MRRGLAKVLRHAGVVGGLTLACSAPALAGKDRPPEEETCTLGAECARWGTLIEEAELAGATCVATAPAALPLAWVQPLAAPTCPFGQCPARDPQLTQDADGSLVTLSVVPVRLQQFRDIEGGLWFTRHTASGVPLASALWDFSVPPPGIAVARHGTLLRDLDGQALFVSARAVLPFDEPRALTMRKLSRNSRIAPSSTTFSTPPGWGGSATQGPAGEWLVSSLRSRPARASLTRYTAHGRLSWRRTWPEGHELRGVQVAPDQSIVALVAQPNFTGFALYKFDVQGVAQWQRKLGSVSEVRLMVDGAGAIYVARGVDDVFSSELRVLQLTPAGHAQVQWSLATAIFLSALASTVDPAGHAALSFPSSGSGFGLNLDWIDLSDGACARTLYAWPPELSPDLNRGAIYADGEGARFFANSTHIGQLSTGGVP